MTCSWRVSADFTVLSTTFKVATHNKSSFEVFRIALTTALLMSTHRVGTAWTPGFFCKNCWASQEGSLRRHQIQTSRSTSWCGLRQFGLSTSHSKWKTSLSEVTWSGCVYDVHQECWQIFLWSVVLFQSGRLDWLMYFEITSRGKQMVPKEELKNWHLFKVSICVFGGANFGPQFHWTLFRNGHRNGSYRFQKWGCVAGPLVPDFVNNLASLWQARRERKERNLTPKN